MRARAELFLMSPANCDCLLSGVLLREVFGALNGEANFAIDFPTVACELV